MEKIMTKSSEARKTRKESENAVSDSVAVSIKNQNEIWSEYDLSDNSKLRIKPLVMEIRKSNKKDADGNYQYHIRSSIVIDVQQPENKSKKYAYYDLCNYKR
jgi:hypothetical protein